jgi:hypothetical protein
MAYVCYVHDVRHAVADEHEHSNQDVGKDVIPTPEEDDS